MREGANQVLAEAFGKGGNSLGRARVWLLREYATNPLAGSGKVRIVTNNQFRDQLKSAVPSLEVPF